MKRSAAGAFEDTDIGAALQALERQVHAAVLNFSLQRSSLLRLIQQEEKTCAVLRQLDQQQNQEVRAEFFLAAAPASTLTYSHFFFSLFVGQWAALNDLEQKFDAYVRLAF